MSDLWNPKPKTPEEEKTLDEMFDNFTIKELAQEELQRSCARSYVESYDKGFSKKIDLTRDELENPYVEVYHLILQMKNAAQYCEANFIPFDSKTFVYKHTLSVFEFLNLEVKYYKNYKEAQLTIEEEVKHLKRHLFRIKKWCDTELREAAIQELINEKWRQIVR